MGRDPYCSCSMAQGPKDRSPANLTISLLMPRETFKIVRPAGLRHDLPPPAISTWISSPRLEDRGNRGSCLRICWCAIPTMHGGHERFGTARPWVPMSAEALRASTTAFIPGCPNLRCRVMTLARLQSSFPMALSDHSSARLIGLGPTGGGIGWHAVVSARILSRSARLIVAEGPVRGVSVV